nr:hypothetical protein CFP56_54744 [Quercus suber]
MASIGYEEERRRLWNEAWDGRSLRSSALARRSLALERRSLAFSWQRDSASKKIDEASSAEIVVVVEFLVLEDQSSLVEAVLSGRNSVVDGGGTRGRAAHEGYRGGGGGQ